MDELINLRNKIDDIDEKMVELFEERMNVAIDISKLKKQIGKDVLDNSREQEVINRNVKHLKNKGFEKPLKEYIETVMKISRGIQREMINSTSLKIGFQGVPGSYSEQALYQYFGKEVDTKNVKNFEDIFIELKNKDIDYGVVPIENSSTGGISDVYELFNKYNCCITGEVCVKINHHLLGLKGAVIDDIEEVYSHPQGFAQCGEFLKFHPQWKLIPYDNTANSAKLVQKENKKSMAVIASERAAEIYGLNILASYINSNTSNITRFAIVAREMNVSEDADKISVILSTEHKAGSLYNVLKYFAEEKLNLLKIESRPMKNKPWEYFFYIDFEGNINEPSVKEAIDMIKEKSHYFKILGNYKKDGGKE